MAVKKDYVPNGHVEFFKWQDSLVNQVMENALDWQIANPLVVELDNERKVYAQFYSVITNKNTRSRQQVVAHLEAKKQYETYLRNFVKGHLIGNASIPVDAKLAMGLKPRLQNRSSRPAIATAPVVELKALGSFRIALVCRTEGDVSRASIHTDADGVELRYKIGKPLPENFKATDEFLFSTKARITLHLSPEMDGEAISVFARWKNLTNDAKSGPWCNMHTVTIR